MCKLSGAPWQRGSKRKESLQLRLWNLNSSSNSPVAPHQLSCQISVNQRQAETSTNINKHWKTSAKGNDVITNVISANQHFASTFSMQIFKFQMWLQVLLPFSAPPPDAPESLHVSFFKKKGRWAYHLLGEGGGGLVNGGPCKRQFTVWHWGVQFLGNCRIEEIVLPPQTFKLTQK